MAESIARWKGRDPLPRYDYKCPHCNYAAEYTYNSMMKKPPYCPTCGNEMERQPPTGISFTVNGFNAANGYSGKGKE